MGPGGELSDREVEVLRRVALGQTNTDIAHGLYVSVRTVETHRAHVQQKFGLKARADLVRYAREHGLVDQDDEDESRVRSRPQPHSVVPTDAAAVAEVHARGEGGAG